MMSLTRMPIYELPSQKPLSQLRHSRPLSPEYQEDEQVDCGMHPHFSAAFLPTPDEMTTQAHAEYSGYFDYGCVDTTPQYPLEMSTLDADMFDSPSMVFSPAAHCDEPLAVSPSIIKGADCKGLKLAPTPSSTPETTAPSQYYCPSVHSHPRHDLTIACVKEEQCSSGTTSPWSAHSPSSTSSCYTPASSVSGAIGSTTADYEYLQRKKRMFANGEETEYKCDICSKMFQRQYNLTAHMQVHNPDRRRPYKCEHANCRHAFVRHADLRRHIDSVHVRSKAFSCPRCKARFGRKDTARRHYEDGCSRRPTRGVRDDESSGVLMF